MRGCQRGWQALHVFLGLELDAREGVAGGLGLHHAKSVAIDEEQVVDVAVALLQLELTDSDAFARREVHVLAILNEPARLLQQGVNLLAGLRLRRVLAAGWCHRSVSQVDTIRARGLEHYDPPLDRRGLDVAHVESAVTKMRRLIPERFR